MKTSSQTSSHIIALALGLLVLGVLGFAGYRVWTMQQAPGATNVPAQAASVSAPATITNTADLQQAASALDSASAQLNNNLDDSSLNADINSML